MYVRTEAIMTKKAVMLNPKKRSSLIRILRVSPSKRQYLGS